MKHAIILAHPARTSLNAAIARTYQTTIERLGHEVVSIVRYLRSIQAKTRT